MHTYINTHKIYVCKLTHTHICINIYSISVECVGNPPSSGPSARRADHSLPQPLHLKAVFTDQKDRKASIRFEYVNNNH